MESYNGNILPVTLSVILNNQDENIDFTFDLAFDANFNIDYFTSLSKKV